MSLTTEHLRRKITSANDLQSVVRTMKALAASSIGQYEKSVLALDSYYRAVELGLSVCLRKGGSAVRSIVPPPSVEASAVNAVVFGSDQGLVGQFNEDIAEFAIKELGALPGKPHVWAVGERVQARLADAGLSVTAPFIVPNSVEAIAPLVGQILVETETRRERDEAAVLHLFYNHPGEGAVYSPVSQRLLPLDKTWRDQLTARPWPAGNLPEVLGTPTTTLRALIREYLFVSLFRACAESLASENASRLSAMERADRNIGEMLEELDRTFHQLRQSSIDAELFDVIAGYELLAHPSTRHTRPTHISLP